MWTKPKKCGNCGTKAVMPKVIDYPVTQTVEMTTYSVIVRNLPAFVCSNCGEVWLDSTADRLIDREIVKEAGLLLPEEIQSIRARLNLPTESMASLLGISTEELGLIEAGDMIQSQSVDRMVRELKDVTAQSLV